MTRDFAKETDDLPTSTLAPAAMDLLSLRTSEFPGLASRIYLNSASVGPLPQRTQRELANWSDRRGRPWEISDAEQFQTMATARERAAALIGATPQEIAVTTNTSFGLSLAAAGLKFERGDVVVFSAREFPANAYPWLALKEQGVMAEVAPATPDGWPDEGYLVERRYDAAGRLVERLEYANATAAALRATEIGADVVIKATKVDGVYDSDPKQNASAVKFDHMTHLDFLSRRLTVMDSTAVTLCMENNLPLLVLNFWDTNALTSALRGQPVGTLVSG